MSNSKNTHFISEINYPLPFWRYLLVFQSYRQLRSWIFIVAVTALPFYLLSNFFNSESLPGEVILLGIAFGSMFSVMMVAPVEFHFKRKPDRHLCILFDTLDNLGYIKESQAETTTTFRQKLPSWLRWKEGNIVVEKCRDEILVKGGIFILNRLHHAVKNSYLEDE